MPRSIVTELEWREQRLGEIDFPKERLEIVAGFGSGLTTAPDPARTLVWAISDRGPNLKLKDAEKLYGWTPPAEWRGVGGVKLMPRPDIGPSLALLEVREDSIALVKSMRIADRDGSPVSGLPIPESGHAECEPVLDLEGCHLAPDPAGMDTEGVALLADGSFWVSEEYGPSLVQVGSDGRILLRLLPQGMMLADAPYRVIDSLPSLAARRHLNRGFEAIATSPSNERLFVAFQSPLAHPGVEQHKHGRHVRIWRLDREATVAAQYLYRLDDPETFLRDRAQGSVEPSDLKVCEIVALDEDCLLVLERASETSKIYRVLLDPRGSTGPEHLDIETRPTIEELSASGKKLPELDKELLFSSDDWPEVGSDIEGMAPLDERSLLIVSDNDFGCEGKQTRFYRLTFTEDLSASN